jgi:hypothetical protein
MQELGMEYWIMMARNSRNGHGESKKSRNGARCIGYGMATRNRNRAWSITSTAEIGQEVWDMVYGMWG